MLNIPTEKSWRFGASEILQVVLAFLFLLAIPYEHGPFSFLAIDIENMPGFSVFDILILSLSVLILLKQNLHPKLFPLGRQIYIALFLVIASRFVSLLFAPLSATFGQWASVMRYFESGAVIFVFYNIFRNINNLAVFIWSLFVFVLIDAIFILNISLSGSRGLYFSISTWAWLFFFICFLATRLVNGKNKLISMFGLPILFAGVLASQTRSTTLTGLVMLVLVMSRLGQRKRVFKVVFSVVAVLIVSGATIRFIPQVYDQFAQRIESGFNMESSTTNIRFFLWTRALNAFMQYPLTGLGSGGYARADFEGIDERFQFALSNEYEDIRDSHLGTHNTIMDVLANTGIIGFLAYVFWIIAVARLAITELRKKDNGSLLSSIRLVLSAYVLINLATDLLSSVSFTTNSSCAVGMLLAINTYKDISTAS